jgi:Tfp pilus assembly protein PilX
MTRRRQRGTTLIVGLILLSLVTLLGLAGASTAHVETLLVQNEEFRENAATAANLGLELAILDIVNATDPTLVPLRRVGVVADSPDRYEVTTRFAGFELALPQAPGTRLAAAHFEITSTGFSARNAVDQQRLRLLLVVDGPPESTPQPCTPVVEMPCFTRGELQRSSWQHVSSH